HGHTASLTDEAIDSLYAWMPPQTAPQACPEAAFSLTLKGMLDGVEALFTVRGQTATAFKANLAAVRGLLDAPKAPQPSRPEPSQDKTWCTVHDVQMKQTEKNGQRWYSHYDEAAGKWCKGRG